MSVIEEISTVSNSGCDYDVLTNYMHNNFYVLECEYIGWR